MNPDLINAKNQVKELEVLAATDPKRYGVDLNIWKTKVQSLEEHAIANSPEASALLKTNPTAYVEKYGSEQDKKNAGINVPAPAPTPTVPAPAAPAAPTPTPAPSPAPGAPGAPAVPEPAPAASPGAPAPQTLSLDSPNAELIKQLQAKLGGLKVDGAFGPKTLAAVKAYQLSHGLNPDGIVGPKTWESLAGNPSPNSNIEAGMKSSQGGAGAGLPTGGGGGAPSVPVKPEIPSTGNTAIDSLIDVLNNQSPQKTAVDIYKEIYGAMGIDTIKQNYAAQTKDYSDLQEKKAEEAENIKVNPWLSEGIKNAKLKQLDAKYETRELILTNKLKLIETQIDNGRADAQFIAGKTLDQLQQGSKLSQDVILKAIDIVEKQTEAERKAASAGTDLDTQVVEVGGKKILINSKTGQTIRNLGTADSSNIPSPVVSPEQMNDPFIKKILATKGGSKLADTSIQKLDKGLTVLGQLGVLQANIQDVKTGPVLGLFRGNNPWDTNAQTIKSSINAIVPNLARGVFGEVGVLTDNDIKIYSKTLPTLTSTEEVRNAILYITLDMIGKSIKNTLNVNASAGRDVSGFVDIYTEMEAAKNSILSTIPSAQVPTAFNTPKGTTAALGPDGVQYYIPNDKLDAFLKAGGKKI